MEKFKNFINTRSKILFVSSIVSAILFVLILPEFLKYSDFVNNFTNAVALNTNEATIGEVIWSTHANEAFQEFSLIFSCIFVFITLFNLVGYIYKKSEFIFISIGLSVVVTCMSIYVAEIIFIALIALATILNIIGYIEQEKLIKKVN